MANQDHGKYHVEKLDRKINEYTNKKLENNNDKVTHRFGLIA